MSIVILLRDSLDQIIAVLYERKNERIRKARSWIVYLESLFAVLLPSIFSFQWRQTFIYFPISTPEIQSVRTNSGIILKALFFPGEVLPQNRNFSIHHYYSFSPTFSLQKGFLNGFILALPRSLNFLVRIRRYWLQGVPSGARATFGYRLGETIIMARTSNGLRTLWWTTLSPWALLLGYLITAFALWESSLSCWEYQYPFSGIPFTNLTSQDNRLSLHEIRQLEQPTMPRLLIAVLHLSYAWTEQRLFFGTFTSQTRDTQGFSSTFLYFSQDPVVAFLYRIGLFGGGLFFDLSSRRMVFGTSSWICLRLHYPRLEWKKRINNCSKHYK